MKEFRLVQYMNAGESRDFTGGRSAASPLASYFHLKKQRKHKGVFPGGTFHLRGLGKYRSPISEALEAEARAADKPIKLPWHLPKKYLPKNAEPICISKTAYIYQTEDPLFSGHSCGIYWVAIIDAIGKGKSFEHPGRYMLNALKIGCEARGYSIAPAEDDEWIALVSDLKPVRDPIDLSSLKVYAGKGHECCFENRKGRRNAFVHLTAGSKWPPIRIDMLYTENARNVRNIIHDQIMNNRIHESLVHEMLKIMFAEAGWWVNFEVRTGSGNIDFLVKRSRADRHPWTVIEVKLRDNPDAVEQLRRYIEAIQGDVKYHASNSSHFALLWDGGKRCTKLKGVVLCSYPGKETLEEVKRAHRPYDVWTYKYRFTHGRLGIKVWDATNGKLIMRTR
jgi:hypothetical protein